MRIIGRGAWGPPRDGTNRWPPCDELVDLGVNLIDTAESYGPHVSEELIADALHPYPSHLVMATKGGYNRTGPDEWDNRLPSRTSA